MEREAFSTGKARGLPAAVATCSTAAGRLERVQFCCNGEQGEFTGRLIAVSYRGLEITYTHLNGCVIDFTGPHRVRISRREFHYVSRGTWSGSWCWDELRMRRLEAHRLVGYLRSIEHFACEGGPMRLCDWWDRGGLRA